VTTGNVFIFYTSQPNGGLLHVYITPCRRSFKNTVLLLSLERVCQYTSDKTKKSVSRKMATELWLRKTYILFYVKPELVTDCVGTCVLSVQDLQDCGSRRRGRGGPKVAHSVIRPLWTAQSYWWCDTYNFPLLIYLPSL